MKKNIKKMVLQELGDNRFLYKNLINKKHIKTIELVLSWYKQKDVAKFTNQTEAGVSYIITSVCKKLHK